MEEPQRGLELESYYDTEATREPTTNKEVILDIKQRMIRLQSTCPEKLGNKEDPKRDMLGSY